MAEEHTVQEEEAGEHYAQNDEEAAERIRLAQERGQALQEEQKELRAALGAFTGWYQVMAAIAGEEPRQAWQQDLPDQPPRRIFGQGKNPPRIPFPNYPLDLNACVKDLVPEIVRMAQELEQTNVSFMMMLGWNDVASAWVDNPMEPPDLIGHAPNRDLAMAICRLAREVITAYRKEAGE